MINTQHFRFAIMLCLTALTLVGVQAQQDAMFTKYMFNSLVYNPAYAGSKDFMSVGLLHRSQWVAIEGAPTTQSFTIHSPLRNERVGLGFNLVNDAIGPTNTLGANLSYAYRIPIGPFRLSVGLQGGIENFRADWTKVTLENPGDAAFDMSPNRWLPNFGAGLMLFNERFYAGFSSPHLVEYDLRPNNDPDIQIYSRQYRHYYATVGAAFPMGSEDFMFKPSLLVKNVGLFNSFRKNDIASTVGAPTEIDLDASVLFYRTLWVGTSFRTAVEAVNGRSSFDSVDLWASWNLDNGLRIGAAYDYPLTELRRSTVGAFEVMLGYEFNFFTKRMVTPRYF